MEDIALNIRYDPTLLQFGITKSCLPPTQELKIKKPPLDKLPCSYAQLVPFHSFSSNEDLEEIMDPVNMANRTKQIREASFRVFRKVSASSIFCSPRHFVSLKPELFVRYS